MMFKILFLLLLIISNPRDMILMIAVELLEGRRIL